MGTRQRLSGNRKIVRMSKMFQVTIDYLLGEEDTPKPENNLHEKGLYVSREMAEGFLSYQKRKMLKPVPQSVL